MFFSLVFLPLDSTGVRVFGSLALTWLGLELGLALGIGLGVRVQGLRPQFCDPYCPLVGPG